MKIFHKLFQRMIKMVWAIMVAYMLGLHNVYKQEEKTPEDILIRIEKDGKQEEGSPKD